MPGMSSTFGSVASALHMPAGMRWCGVGAIEAQIAAGGDDAPTSDGSDSSVISQGNIKGNAKGDANGPASPRSAAQTSRGGKQPPANVQPGEGGDGSETSQKGMKKGGKALKGLHKGGKKERGGLRGMISSARSLGWRRGGGGGEDDQTRTSQVSGFSFLSGGLKMLASRGKKMLRSLQGPSRLFDDGTADALSDMSSLDQSTTAGTEAEELARGEFLWRRVQMFVSGVLGEGPDFSGTVRYRAARRIQGIARVTLARKKAVERRCLARAARRYGEECRLRRRRQEAEAKKRHKETCRELGQRMFEWSVKCFLQPRAIIDLQRVWRGHRARKRLAAYLKWLEDKARRRREYQRYLAALAAQRKAGDNYSEQVKRRVWGRSEFAHTGWRPRYEVENPPNMFDHVWTPPRGSSSGVRTFKIFLPPGSERDRLTLTTDENAWAGVPVGIGKRRPPPKDLGPSPRSRGNVGGSAAYRALHPSGGDGEDNQGGEVVMKYNWLPSPLVAGVELLQTPLDTRY